jgi:hypothetical protein
MHKFLLAGLLALGVLATSQQRAAAWIDCHFCIGLGWHWQSGGNSCCWGVFHGGPAPWGYGYAPFPAYGPGFPHGALPPAPPVPLTAGHGHDPFYFLQWD